MRERRRAWRPGGWPSRSLPISQKRCLPSSSSRPSTTPFLLHFDYRISHHSQRPYDHQYNINSLPKEFEQQMLGGYVRTPQSSGGHGRVLTYHITTSTIVIVVITFFIINIKHTIIIITCICSAAKREVASDLPASVDWREKGVITEPKNQVGYKFL